MPTPTSKAQRSSSLREFYEARGEVMPSQAERAKLYERAGLGVAGTYVCSADQNNKLLGWLKRSAA